LNQIDDLIEEIQVRCELDERVLVTTLTKRMAEELAKYLTKVNIRCRYIHSEVDTLERIEIMQDLRKGILMFLLELTYFVKDLIYQRFRLLQFLMLTKKVFFVTTDLLRKLLVVPQEI